MKSLPYHFLSFFTCFHSFLLFYHKPIRTLKTSMDPFHPPSRCHPKLYNFAVLSEAMYYIISPHSSMSLYSSWLACAEGVCKSLLSTGTSEVLPIFFPSINTALHNYASTLHVSSLLILISFHGDTHFWAFQTLVKSSHSLFSLIVPSFPSHLLSHQ